MRHFAQCHPTLGLRDVDDRWSERWLGWVGVSDAGVQRCELTIVVINGCCRLRRGEGAIKGCHVKQMQFFSRGQSNLMISCTRFACEAAVVRLLR